MIIEDILKENGGKKFDVVLMNPPYGSVGGDVIHLKFVDKLLDISNKQVAIFPFSLITKSNKPTNKFKEKFSKYLKTVEEINSNKFSDTHMPNVGIYYFDNDKDEDLNIEIIPINGDKRYLKSLLEVSKFSDYEKEIIKYLEDNGQQEILWAGGMDKRKKELDKIPLNKQEEFLKNKIIQNCKRLKEKFINYNACLIANQANGGMNGRAFSNKNGQIIDNYKDAENLFINLKCSSGYNVLMFNSIKAAENCKIALKNPLLRFTIYRIQDDQMMFTRVYKYVPAIDWSDDRVKTDEGLLEVCGCPKDKCKEYADYCKKIIDEVDKK